MPKIELECHVCNKPFKVSPYRVNTAKYCNRKCQSIGQTKQVDKICKYCGKSFKAKAGEIKRGNVQYCSHNCHNMDRSIEMVCKQCGKTFREQKSRVKSGLGIYCSKECYNLSMVTRITKNCKQCGKPFEVRQWKHKIGKGNFCSHKCAYEFNKGETAYNWRGGTSNEPYAHDFNNQLKNNIKNRDNNNCQICFKSLDGNGDTCIHHIDYDKKNSSENNLISLCFSCHTKTNYNREYWTEMFTNYMINYSKI